LSENDPIENAPFRGSNSFLSSNRLDSSDGGKAPLRGESGEERSPSSSPSENNSPSSSSSSSRDNNNNNDNNKSSRDDAFDSKISGPAEFRTLPNLNSSKPEKPEFPDEIDTVHFVPPNLGLFQLWFPTTMIVFFLGIMVFVLMWLYVYVSFNSYQDRITVLSLSNLFNQTPQLTFQKYIKQATQESIAAAMQDIQTSGNDVQTTVNRLQTQVAASLPATQSIDNLLQPMVQWLQSTLGQNYVSGDTVTSPGTAV